MDILFTNHRPTSFGGTEAIIRDLVLNLLARGHRAVAYSSRRALPGNSMADQGVPIIDRLDDLPFMPDVIHGQHNMDSMTAVMALPGVPAVYCCHGATRSDAQPRHPRILRYTAMSASLKLRMAIESCIPEEMIEVVHNAVDLRRFRDVREPPERPRRALVYSRVVAEASPLGAAIKAAAGQRGLEIAFGSATGKLRRGIERPESGLLDYDLIFASGKSAIDALACGCAVIVVGAAGGGFASAGCGEMVSTANFERLRLANFSAPFNTPSPTASEVGAQIDRYEAGDVIATTRQLRGVANFDAYIDRYLAIYRQVIERAESGWDQRAEQLAAHVFLRSLFTWVRLGEERWLDNHNPAGNRAASGEPGRSLNAPFLIAEAKRQLAAIEGH